MEASPKAENTFEFPESWGVTVQPTEEETEHGTRPVNSANSSRPEPSTTRIIRLVRASRLAGTEKNRLADQFTSLRGKAMEGLVDDETGVGRPLRHVGGSLRLIAE